MANYVYAVGMWWHFYCHHHPASLSLLSSVYRTPGHMVDAIEFICSLYIDIPSPLRHLNNFSLWHLFGILGAYLLLAHILH